MDALIEEIRELIASYHSSSGCDGHDGDYIAGQLVPLVELLLEVMP